MLLAAHGRVMEEAGGSPVYLLDDVDAELAPPTVAAVWEVFRGAAPALRHLQPPAGLADPGRGEDLGDGEGGLRLLSA